MASFRCFLPVLFTLGLHGALAGLLLLLPQADISAANTVYEISLTDFSAAAGAGPCLPAAQDASPNLSATPPPPDAPAPAELPAAPLPAPVPEEKIISTKKNVEPEKKTPRPRKSPPPPVPAQRQAPAAPAAPAEAPQALQTAAAAAGNAGSGGGKGGARSVGGLAAYNTNEVDQIPAIARKVMPDYPPKARRLDLQGRVVVRLVVNTAGEPQACVVHEANPPGYFEDAALEAARRTRFIPGKLKGQAVNTVVLLPFTFSLR